MIKADYYLLENLNKVLKYGMTDVDPRPKYKDGNPAHTKFITQVFETYDIFKGEFPIPTLRNTAIKTGVAEIIWIYVLQSNKLEDAHKLGIDWWDDWDVGDKSIGNRYGYTVKKYDLIGKLLKGLRDDPYGRRHIMNLYQEEDLNSGPGLFPCCYETLWSFDGRLNLHLNIRSNDYLVAGAINRIQYVALLLMVCGHLGYTPGTFSVFTNNLHIYDRHIDAANEILGRQPQNIQPKIEIPAKNFLDYSVFDVKITDNVGVKLVSQLELGI